MTMPSIDGVLVLDKSAGMTSRAALDAALRWFPRGTKSGHAGTLDPLTTGVLVLCLGKATRLVEYVQRMSKTYRAGIRLGVTSDTDDADGVVTDVPNALPPTQDDLVAALHAFVGTIAQTPPAHSAAKVAGARAYDLARRGQKVQLQPRAVTIHAVKLSRYDWPFVDLEIDCGKGTYIRGIARDLGLRLGCGGMVQTLRRTRIGPFTTDSAVTLDVEAGNARARLLPMEAALSELPPVAVNDEDARRLGQGQPVAWQDGPGAADVAVFNHAGALLGVGTVDPKQRVLRPAKMLRA